MALWRGTPVATKKDKPRLLATDYGPKPDMRWVPAGQLRVNSEYQRTLESRRSQNLITRIVAEFNWSKFGALLVSETEPGVYEIIDGQHRHAAAAELSIATVPCVIVALGSVAERARTFVGANADRVAVNPYAMHYAQVTAGNPAAIELAKVCADTGMSIPRYPIAATGLKPGQTLAIGALSWGLRCYGTQRTVRAMTALMMALRDQPGRLRAPMIKAVIVLLASGENEEKLVRALRNHSEADFEATVFVWMRERGAIDQFHAHCEAIKWLMHGAAAGKTSAKVGTEVGADVLETLRRDGLTQRLAPGVSRRCADCGQIFAPKRVGETRCGCRKRAHATQ